MTKAEMLKWLSRYAGVGNVVRLVKERCYSPSELDWMQQQMRPYVKMKEKFKKARGA